MVTTKKEKLTVTLIKGEAAIMKTAQSLSRQAAGYALKLHQCLTSALAHALEHGNVTVVENVFQTIDASTDRRQIDAWIRGNSNLTYREVKGIKMYRKPEGKALIIRVNEAMATPFWTYAPTGEPAQPRLVDVEQRIVSFIRSLETAIVKGLVKHEPKENKETAIKRAKRSVDKLADFVAREFHVARAIMDPPPSVEPARANVASRHSHDGAPSPANA